MRLATIIHEQEEKGALVVEDGLILIEDLNQATGDQWNTTIFELIQDDQLKALQKRTENLFEKIPELKTTLISKKDVTFGPLYRHPRKIWGIGLNYVDHASDLSEKAPSTEPASFMKPDTTIIGPGDEIKVPHQSERTTAESELGVIIGKTCKDVTLEEAETVIAGYTTIIDMTAEDILQVNPRYLTRAKSFDTFFSFGPVLVTPDEVPDVHELTVATIINGRIHRENKVKNMTFKPFDLVSFHSKVMTLLPGDIISTGTPGAVVIGEGDVVSCTIDHFEPLTNPVKDLKIISDSNRSAITTSKEVTN